MKYEKLDPITHIHRRPDTYIGSLRVRSNPREWVATDDLQIRERQNVAYSDGLLRIFIEPLSNIIDNVWRSRRSGITPTKIKISIDRASGKTQFWNDGLHIPVEMHETEKIYNPELVFGHLMAGSNMNDNEQRLSSGRNGLGVKLLNIFSKEFSVEIYDPVHHLLYQQTWKNNMRERSPPKIKPRTKGKMGYCCITYTPDFEKFHQEGYDDTIMALYTKYCMDAAMITRLPVSLNDNKFVFRTMADYVRLYPMQEVLLVDCNPWDYKTPEYHTSVVIATSMTEDYREIGFVNGVYTSEGGVHTEAVMTELMNHLMPKFSKHGITPKDLKQYFMVFVCAWIPNPEFSSQSKTRLLSPPFPFQLETKHVTQILKWSFVGKVTELIKTKQLLTLRKTEKKTKQFRQIEGLDPANLAGTRHAQDCTLILCEGLSAKTYATKGIASGWNHKKGRDYFGIYPLRGKLLNVRNATMKSISQNKEITDIIHTLGLKHQVDYTKPENFRSLRYGRVLIITDADEDGHHICSLILNLFHTLFPSLLMMDFFYLMMTPVAKIFHGSQVSDYYNDFEYQKDLDAFTQSGKKIRVKYFKGLGTNTDEEIRSTFGQKVVALTHDEQTNLFMNKLFHKNFSNDRKEWLTTYNPNQYDTPIDRYPISTYFCQDLIKFSIGDCRRNIPCLFDGLKVSQRKILYSVFKKNLDSQGKSMKVAQLAGYCAETSNYHHGEQCLYDTITRMSQDYPGSNNIPYFARDGQFGSRSYLGKDAASARYIFTRCTRLTRLIFPVEDDNLLEYTMDDGDRVEPDFYLPIIPMVLVNGCSAGIGTGWSCFIPCYNPIDIIQIIRQWLDGHDDGSVRSLELTPYYHGFTGTFTKLDKNKYECRGVMKEVSNKKGKRLYEITEVPIFSATNKYKEDLEVLLETKKLRSLVNYSTPDTVHFIIEPADDFQPTMENLKLVSMISTNNLVLFEENHKLCRFDSVGDILLVYMKKRLGLYGTRRLRLIQSMEEDIHHAKQKMRFIAEVEKGTIKVFRVPEEQIHAQLMERGYTLTDGLLNIPLKDFTKAKIQALSDKIKKLEQSLDRIKKKTPEQFWRDELDKLLEEYHKL